MGLITHLQLLVGHGGQSCHIKGEVVGGAHVWLSVGRRLVVPHRQALRHTRRRDRQREAVTDEAGVKRSQRHQLFMEQRRLLGLMLCSLSSLDIDT